VEQRDDDGRHDCRLSENARNLNRRNAYRFSGRHSPDAIDYAVTIDDPKTFTNTWTIGVPLKQDKEQTETFEYACHEGNYAMRNILSSARADEKAARKHSVRLNPRTLRLYCVNTRIVPSPLFSRNT
jgi:hypothetical protein